MEALKELRRRKGLSQRDLAEASGVGQDTISGIESGRHEPRPSTLRKLANALNVEVADFFREPGTIRASTSIPAKSDVQANATVSVPLPLFAHVLEAAMGNRDPEPAKLREANGILEGAAT